MEVQAVNSKEEKKVTWREYVRVNRKLIPLKVFMTFFYGGFVALYPYLTIHMKSIGISVTQTGLLYCFYPVTVCIGGPLAGVIGDKTGHYKLVLMIFLVLSIIFHGCLYYAVPSYQVSQVNFNHTISNVQLEMRCDDSEMSLMSYTNATMDFNKCHTADISSSSYVTLYSCNTDCLQNTAHQLGPSILIPSDTNVHTVLRYNQILRTQSSGATFLNTTSDSNASPTARWLVNNGPYCVDNLSCSVTCHAGVDLLLPCSEEQIIGNQYTTFGVYLCIRLLCGLSVNLVFTLVDASLLQMVDDFKGDVGINRAFAGIGFCIVPPISGLLVDYYSKLKGSVDFRPAFFVFFGGLILAIISLFFTEVRVRPGSKDIWKNATQLLRYPRVVAFILAFFVVGTAWGFLESFLFWFLDEDLKAEKWLLGFTNTVAGVAGIPFAAFATQIVKKTGFTKVFICGIFVFGLRFLGYSYVYNPYWILPLEALEALTCTLPLVTASIYAASFSAELLATLQGTLSAVHFGLGRGMGSLMGGFMIRDLGTRLSFQVFAGICFGASIIYAIFHYAYLRHSPKTVKRPPRQEEATRLFTDTVKEHPAIRKEEPEEDLNKDTLSPHAENLYKRRRSSILPVFDLGSTELAPWAGTTAELSPKNDEQLRLRKISRSPESPTIREV